MIAKLHVCPFVPIIGPSHEVIDTVPEQVAVPLDSVAVVGGAVAPVPPFESSSGVPFATVLASVNVSVAAAPVEPLLNPLTLQVSPAVPVIAPPES